MDSKHDNNQIKLTSAEIAQLWASYMSSSMSYCMISYFKKSAQEPALNSILDILISRINDSIKSITDIFNTENHPIPYGFTKEDVDLSAKPLYSDVFIAEYIKLGSKFALLSYANALAISARSDVRSFFTARVQSACDISKRIDDFRLEKGIYIRAPIIPVPQEVEFIQKQSFMNGFIGEKRPLNAMEMSHLYSNIETNRLGKALITSFAQTAKSENIKDSMIIGKSIAIKHIDLFTEILKESDVPVPSGWDSEVTASIEAPFSEKLMMFHISALISFSIGSYGLAIANSMRSDLVLTFTRLMADLGKYAKDGADLMIDNSWLEEIPEAVNRKELVHI